MRHWNRQNPHRISRQPEDHNSPFADADDAPCTSMDGVKRNVRQNCHELLRTFSSIGDPIVVQSSRSGKRHGRLLANDTTTSFADDDYRSCNLVVIGQLIQRFKYCFNYHTLLELNAEFDCCIKLVLLPAELALCYVW